MVQVGVKTDRGQRRENNEDAFFVIPEDKVYMIADGLGGYNSGEVASRQTVSILADYIKENPVSKVIGKDDICAYIVEAIQEVNKVIWELARSKEEYLRMATTLVFVYVTGNTSYIANVGDSRAYLFRNDKITQITEDHSIVADMVAQGTLSREEARIHPDRNQLTRAIGAEKDVVPNVYEIKLRSKDLVLLCTDGLYGELTDDEIADILNRKESLSEICTDLVTEANRAGGNDNITVVCLKLQD